MSTGMIGWAGIFLVAMNLQAADTPSLRAPDFSLAARAREGALEITAIPPAFHHFNLKAPMSLIAGASVGSARPVEAQEKQIVFNSPSALTAPFIVSLYLCDDRETYCEKHRLKASWNVAKGELLAESEESGSTPAPETVSAPAPAKLEHGFIMNDPDRALKFAHDLQKPLLIDFFGIWCPPCNQLDEEVFSKPDFVRASANFIKLKLDADSPVSWPLKSRYKVGGYPTLIFASSEGEEISRVVGFLPEKELRTRLQQAWAARDAAFPALKSKADSGDAAAAGKVGAIYLHRMEYDQAVKYLGKVQDPSAKAELAEAEVGLWTQKNDEGAPEAEMHLTEALEKSIHLDPKLPDSLDRRVTLAELYSARKNPERQKVVLQEGIAVAHQLIRNPGGLAAYGANVADIWSSIADMQDTLGQLAQSRAAWKNAAREYGKLATSDQERAYNLELGYALWKSGDFSTADALYRRLESRYPREFTFYYGHAQMCFQQKSLVRAHELAQQAYGYSYGDNRLRVVALLAKILRDQGQREEGLSLIRATLGSGALPEDRTIRTHRYVKTLQDLESQLNASPSAHS